MMIVIIIFFYLASLMRMIVIIIIFHLASLMRKGAVSTATFPSTDFCLVNGGPIVAFSSSYIPVARFSPSSYMPFVSANVWSIDIL